MTGEPHLLNVYSRWPVLTRASWRSRLLAAVGQVVRAAARLEKLG